MPTSPESLSIPIFLSKRQQIIKKGTDELKQHMQNKAKLYAKACEEGNVKMTGPHKKFLQTMGLLPSSKPPCERPAMKRTTERFKESRDEYLPPNLYNTGYEPFSRFRQLSNKNYMEASSRKKRKKASDLEFYPKKTFLDKWQDRNNIKKGKFLQGPQHGKLYSRIALLDPCQNDPNGPTPASYYHRAHEISSRVSQPIYEKPPMAYKFYKATTVPEYDLAFLPKTDFFHPPPGYYDASYKPSCLCQPRLIYRPRLDLMIEREKRLKFRRHGWTPISKKKFCVPDLKHIEGGGHKHLFKIPTDLKKQWAKEDLTKKPVTSMKDMKLYADVKYLNLINLPPPLIDNKWDPPLPKRKYKIEFFSIINPAKAKHKKIISKAMGFSSSAPREVCPKRRLPLSREDVDRIKASLPKHLRCGNKPITKTPIKEIPARLLDIKKAEVPRTLGHSIDKPPKIKFAVPMEKRLYDESAYQIPEADRKPLFQTTKFMTKYLKNQKKF